MLNVSFYSYFSPFISGFVRLGCRSDYAFILPCHFFFQKTRIAVRLSRWSDRGIFYRWEEIYNVRVDSKALAARKTSTIFSPHLADFSLYRLYFRFAYRITVFPSLTIFHHFSSSSGATCSPIPPSLLGTLSSHLVLPPFHLSPLYSLPKKLCSLFLAATDCWNHVIYVNGCDERKRSLANKKWIASVFVCWVSF